MDSERSRCGLGAISQWTLGIRCSMGLDVGRRRALGVCAFPLRALGCGSGRGLGLGAWACSCCWRCLRTAGLCACAGSVCWRRSSCGIDRTRRSFRSWSGVVSSGTARCVGAFLSRERGVCVTGQRDEFASDQPDGSGERLQHHGGESDDCSEPQLHVPEFSTCGHCGFKECVPEW